MERLASFRLPLATSISLALWVVAASATPHGEWVPHPGPPVDQVASGAYDSFRNQLVIFSGHTPGNLFYSNDIFGLNLSGTPSWNMIRAFNKPEGRVGHATVYDPVRDLIMVFGGGASVAVVSPAAGEWSTVGIEPPPTGDRTYATAIYDPVRDRVIVCSGGGPADHADLWALSLTSYQWTQLLPAGTPPSARSRHVAIYDPVRDRMLVFGGTSDPQVWALSLAGSPEWTPLGASGGPPPPGSTLAGVYDSARDQMIVIDGDSGTGRLEVYALSLSSGPAWSQLAPTGAPSERAGFVACYDAARDRVVCTGGGSQEVWALSLDPVPAWAIVRHAPLGTRSFHSAVYDSEHRRMVVFGGYITAVTYHFSLNDGGFLSLGGDPAWETYQPAGGPPHHREAHGAIYDPVRDRVLIYGGVSYPDATAPEDLWELALSGVPTWTQLMSSGFGGGGRTAVYDPLRDRIVEWSLPTLRELPLAGPLAWNLVPTAGAGPTHVGGASTTHDPLRDRLIVFGGSGGVVSNEVWALTLSATPTWSQLLPTGTPPTGRFEHTAVYDGTRDRIVIFGGETGTIAGRTNEAWELRLAGTPAWRKLAPTGTLPTGRARHTAIYDPEHDRMVVFGGRVPADHWILEFRDSPASAPNSRNVHEGGIVAVVPNPSRSGVRIEYAVPHAAHVRVDILDVAGRRIATLVDRGAPAGRHSVAWTGQQGPGRIPTGVYFARCTLPGGSTYRRVVVTR